MFFSRPPPFTPPHPLQPPIQPLVPRPAIGAFGQNRALSSVSRWGRRGGRSGAPCVTRGGDLGMQVPSAVGRYLMGVDSGWRVDGRVRLALPGRGSLLCPVVTHPPPCRAGSRSRHQSQRWYNRSPRPSSRGPTRLPTQLPGQWRFVTLASQNSKGVREGTHSVRNWKFGRMPLTHPPGPLVRLVPWTPPSLE